MYASPTVTQEPKIQSCQLKKVVPRKKGSKWGPILERYVPGQGSYLNDVIASVFTSFIFISKLDISLVFFAMNIYPEEFSLKNAISKHEKLGQYYKVIRRARHTCVTTKHACCTNKSYKALLLHQQKATKHVCSAQCETKHAHISPGINKT